MFDVLGCLESDRLLKKFGLRDALRGHSDQLALKILFLDEALLWCFNKTLILILIVSRLFIAIFDTNE